MNATEIRNTIKNTAAQNFIDQNPECAASVEDDYVYVVPVEVEGKTMYAKWTLTACQWADTKSRAAFNFQKDTLDAQKSLDELISKQMEAKKSSEEKKAKKTKKKSKEEE